MTRLKEIRMAHGVKQSELAAQLSTSQATISAWESGKYQIDDDNKIRIASIFNVTLDYLMGLDPAPRAKGVKVPVLGVIHAGIPLEAITDVIDYEDIPVGMAATGEYFGLKVRGNSMSPGICEGDVVIVRRQSQVEDGQVAVVLVNGADATLKEIQYSPAGITLVGWNVAEYAPRFYPAAEAARLPVRILGLVVEVRRRLYGV